MDGSGHAFVTGLSYSPDFPVTSGAVQSANDSGGDAFVSKIDTGSSGLPSLLYSTFLGGSGLDEGNAIAVDNVGNAYVAGQTNSLAVTLGFPPPSGVFQSDCTLDAQLTCEGDAFVAKFTSSGALTYFTYLGGSKADAATGIAVDSSGDAYVTGSTVSGASASDVPFPVITAAPNAAFQPKYGGGNADAFVTELNPTGTVLIYSSYLGGTDTEVPSGIAVDTATPPNAYLTGQTCSQDFPLSNPLQALPGGNCDAYITKVSVLDGLALNPAGLVFPAQSLNTTSQAETFTVTNYGSARTISILPISGTNPGDFAETNNCLTAPLAAGGTCTINVTFTPSGVGNRQASLSIVDNTSGSTLVGNLNGSTSTVSLSTSGLVFGSQQVGIASAPQTVTVSNIGTAPVSFASITASGDFSETDNCTKAALPPNGTCTVNVTFTPSTVGASQGSIILSDAGSGSQQIISTSGTGVPVQPFVIGSLTSTPVVPAGKTATYSISVTSPNGFSQPVALGCTAPATLSCTISPSTVTPTATQTGLATLTVGTSLRTLAPPTSGIKIDPIDMLRHFNATWLLWLAAILMVGAVATFRRRPITAAFGFAVVLLLASAACGGGAPGVPAGTPVGTYQITVTGTSGTVTSSTQVAIQVQ